MKKLEHKVPNLRFKDFTDDWEQRKLGEISTSFSGGTPSVKNKSYYGGKIPFIRSAEIHKDKTELFITENGLKNSSAKLIKKGTLLYALYGATSGEVDVSNIDGAINQAIMAIFLQKDNVSFIKYYLEKNKYKIIAKYLQGGQGNLSASIIKSVHINLPFTEEQLKISNLIKKVESLISLQQRKLELLKEIKKGFLQKMFADQDRKQPVLRFKGFHDDWEQRKLGETVFVNSGKDYKGLQKGNIPVYGTGGYMLSVNKYLSNKDAIGIGRKGTINNPYILKAPFWTVDTLFYAIPQNQSDIEFMNAIFQNVNWHKYDESTGVPSLSKSTINQVKVYTTSLREQAAIGSLLHKIEKTISLQHQKLAKYQSIKKSLLQQMFI
ncbi:restriction endonuclease subunit S [Limosilactobacillus reuteri subsp. suis]|uniref:restriction endonuclease subunit S n=1 Tax=Limosilactobacillus reuteri TaxID=1598 RepID=UPI003993890F